MTVTSTPTASSGPTITANPTDDAINELVALTKNDYGSLSENEFKEFVATDEGKIWHKEHGFPTFDALNTNGNDYISIYDLSVPPPSKAANLTPQGHVSALIEATRPKT